MKSIFIQITVLSFLSITAWARPSQIIFVRHGEKIDDTHRDLSPKGCERAYQLPLFFQDNKAQIAAIYAQQPNKSSGSIRPLETVAPLAFEYNMKIQNQFTRDQSKEVADAILKNPAYDNKIVVVAWEHTAILKIVQQLGIALNGNLSSWPGSVFDQAWVVTFPSTGQGPPQLEIVAEEVLPTDIESNQSGIANWGKPEVPPQNNGVFVPANIIAECEQGNTQLDQKMQAAIELPLPLLDDSSAL